jgi:hypothetical protein
MKLIDANALVLLLIGTVDPKLINNHKRTSIYEDQDYYDLIAFIGDIQSLVVLPNVWTEVDNLLNNFTKKRKVDYISNITEVIKLSSEKYLESIVAAGSNSFYDLGLTDSLLLEYGKNCDWLITSDSSLSDYALAHGINVFDIVKNRNNKL